MYKAYLSSPSLQLSELSKGNLTQSLESLNEMTFRISPLWLLIKMMQKIRRGTESSGNTVFYFDDISSMKNSTVMKQMQGWENNSKEIFLKKLF